METAVECGLASGRLDRLVVSTDSEEIAEAAVVAGASVPFLRPAELAQDASPKWEVFKHLVEWFERENDVRVTILVDLDVGFPMRTAHDIDACVALLQDSDAEVVTTAFEPDRNPYFNMVEEGELGFYEIVKKPANPIHNRQQAPRVLSLSPAVYAMRRSVLDVVDHWSQAKMATHVIPRECAWDIDTETDLDFVRFLVERRKTV